MRDERVEAIDRHFPICGHHLREREIGKSGGGTVREEDPGLRYENLTLRSRDKSDRIGECDMELGFWLFPLYDFRES